MDHFAAAKHIRDDVGAMQPREHIVAVADAAMNKSHVMDLIEWRDKGVAGQRADLGCHRKFADTLDQFVACLPVGDEFGDGDARQLVLLREVGKFGAAHHGSVVVHQLGQNADWRNAGEPA